ncbi:MAG: hypothetical protein ACPK85_09360 [Methanosarcina sp.]
MDGKMIETIWIIIPNLIASYMVMVNKAFYANLIYCFGYLLFIWHNYNSGDSSQMIYFTILEIMSIVGVFLYIYTARKTTGKTTEKTAGIKSKKLTNTELN